MRDRNPPQFRRGQRYVVAERLDVPRQEAHGLDIAGDDGGERGVEIGHQWR
jgi:hypothetical protein